MTEGGPKHPRNPWPSDEAPTVRTDLETLFAKHGQPPGMSEPTLEDPAVVDTPTAQDAPDAPPPLPKVGRRQRVQTVMGVAPPPVVVPQARPAPPVQPPAPQPPPPQPPAPQPPPPPTHLAPAKEATVQIAPNPDQTSPRRGISSYPPPRVPFSALIGSSLLSALVAAGVALGVVLLVPRLQGSTDASTLVPQVAAAAPARGEAVVVSAARASGAETPRPASNGSVVARARNGEAEAVAALEAKAPIDRSIDESIALSFGRSATKRAELVELQKALSSGEPKPDLLKKLRNWADDSDVSRDALAVMASLPGSVSADLVYDVWVGNPNRTVATALAEELAQSRTIRDKASPELSLALDFRAAKTCEQVAPLLERAHKEGDRRLIPLLGRLTKRKGCGLENDAMCAPCSANYGPAILAAIGKVKGRKAPKF